MKVTMTSSSFPPHTSTASSSILLNTGHVVFDCAKDKSSIVNGKQLLTNKPLNVGLTAGSQHSLTSSATNNNINNNTGSSKNASKNQKTRDKHKPNKYAPDDPGGRERQKGCCQCMGPKSTAFWVGLLTNLGICTLLFAYTLLGG